MRRSARFVGGDLGSEEGFSFPVGDKLAEACIGEGVELTVSGLPELAGEEAECRVGVSRVFPDYEYVYDSATLQRKPLAKHLQKVSFPGLPADDQDFCDGGEQLLEVYAMVRRPFKGVLGFGLYWNGDRREYGPWVYVQLAGVGGVGNEVLVREFYGVGLFDELRGTEPAVWGSIDESGPVNGTVGLEEL